MSKAVGVGVAAVAGLALVVPLGVTLLNESSSAALASISNNSCGGDPAASAPGKIVWPVPGRQTGTYPGHDGVDINRGAANQDEGDPIVAAAAGTVTYVGTGKGYGVAIFIKTDLGPTNIYGHTSATNVRAGQHVAAGEKIGAVGNTGNSSAAHLHFGVVPGLSYQASMDFLNRATAAGSPLPAGSRWTQAQLRIAQTAIAVGKAHNIPEKGWVVIIAAGLVESGLRNLTYGDRDSRGWLQQRPSSGWGTISQIEDVTLAAEAFYGVAKHTSNRGLTDVFNWQSKPVGEVAQSVQVSGFPGRYAQQEANARAIVALLGGTPAAPAGLDCAGTGAGDISGPVQLVAELNPKGTGNWQGAVKGGGYWFVAHATRGDRTAIFHRLNAAGQEIDQMVITGGQMHPTGFAVIGNKIYAAYGADIVSFPYQPGKTIGKSGTKPMGHRGEISADPTGRTVVIRNGNRYQLINTTTGAQQGVDVRTPTGARQGFSVSGAVLYVLTGPVNAPARVDTYSFTTGQQLSTRDVTDVGFKPGEPRTFREPEGMFSNLMGVKVMNGDRRRLRVYALTPARPTDTSGAAPTGAAPAGWPILPNGLAPNTERGRLLVTKIFGVQVSVPQCKASAGHVSDSYHYTGHACDVMTNANKALGFKISRWAKANHKSLGVVQVIHNSQIWTVERDGEGWRPYSGASDHSEHVHLSFDRSRD